MKSLKRCLAYILCICILVTTNGFTSFAMENGAVYDSENGTVATGTDALEEQDVNSQDVSLNKTEQVTEEITEDKTAEDDTSEEEITDKETTEETTESEEESEAPLLNYIVIENDYVETPASQYVVASIGEEGIVIEEAYLNYINQTTGISYKVSASKIVDSAILFNLDFSDNSYTGIYKLTDITYVVDGNEYKVTMAEAGLDAVFGVNTTVDADPYAWLVDEDTEDTYDVSGVITDANGDRMTADDVAKAIAENTPDGLNKASNGNMIIVLDPGHGAEDTGATRTYNGVTYYERDLNLKIAQACKTELEKYAGVTVYMTRYDNNTKPSLTNRAEIAKSYNADVLISIHNNSSSGDTANGSEVWVPNSDSYNYYAHTTGEELGNTILDALASLGLNKRGVYTRMATDGDTYPSGGTSDYYTIINESRRRGIPCIIVEHAYLSNYSDTMNYLSTDAKLKALGVSDANAIAEYFGLSTNPNEYGGVDYSAVYDYDYYISKYPSLKNTYGNSKKAVLGHFVKYGMAEGRRASDEFDVNYYMNKYDSLKKRYGNDLKLYYLHYINYGKNEGRDGKSPNEYNGVDYSAVYDYDYYISKYPSLKNAYGNSKKSILEHFIKYGMAEGRQASDEFNVYYYKNRYVGLRINFGTDLKQYYLHYINYGKKEGRDGKTYSDLVGGVTKFNGIDYSAVYDYDYYTTKYPSLKTTFNNDDIKVLEHFVNYGMKEGRQAKETFNVYSYANKYSGLRKRYKNDLKQYYLHYINYGAKEGRIATGTNTVQDYQTVYNGTDYSAVYDYNYYTSKYPSLKSRYGYDEEAVLSHFVNYGMSEGRQAKSDFNVFYYKNRYVGLRNNFGSNLKQYYIHYINYGKKEGRDGKTYSDLVGGATKLNGVDYSSVYDYNYYITKYPSLKTTFNNDDIKILAHFVNYGMNEGRQASAEFNVYYYKNRYVGLRNNFGTNIREYYLHYMNYGKKEGRDGKTYSPIVGGVNKYCGKDYSAVYDFSYYINMYPDIKGKYNGDDIKILADFVNNGMKEGRKASLEFNVTYYKANYIELQNKYGSDLKQYYMHYINTGKAAGWIADRYILDSIMDTSDTTVAQMVAYYNANATYPSYYAGTDAPTITAFCQIYKEECEAEGVRVDVAFCQAMKETGFLKFGGQVSISQLNFAGLGATDGGAAGASFSTVRQGVRAQVQHLKAYASTDSLKNTCVDPRFSLVTRGSAPYIVWLGIQENPYGKGWATATGYGYSIINDYMAKLKKY